MKRAFPRFSAARVKTLHPKIHGGLLARRDDSTHRAELEQHAIAGIDLLIVNLYPFEEARASKAAAETLVETIDIGGVALIRAAAKNHAFVTVIVEPSDYASLLAELERNDGATTLAFRQALAAKAFARVAAYDAAIAGWLNEVAHEVTPARRVFAGMLKESLRYGENPHQQAALYLTGDPRARRCARDAAARQGALLQQHHRYGRGLRACVRVSAGRRSRGRHHQARQSLRRGARSHAGPSL